MQKGQRLLLYQLIMIFMSSFQYVSIYHGTPLSYPNQAVQHLLPTNSHTMNPLPILLQEPSPSSSTLLSTGTTKYMFLTLPFPTNSHTTSPHPQQYPPPPQPNYCPYQFSYNFALSAESTAATESSISHILVTAASTITSLNPHFD